MIWMSKGAEVHGSSEGAEGDKIVNKYMLDADRQQGQTASFHHTSSPVSRRNFLPLTFKQDVSASAVENRTNKKKYSQYNWCLHTLPVLYIKL